MNSPVTIEQGVVATIRIDNPPLNLISQEVITSLGLALEKLERDDSTRALILAAEGAQAFSAGSDVKEFPSLAGHVAEGKLIAENAVYDQLAGLSIPTIAAIEGDALGGGLELALCCDLRVASETARLGLPELRLGAMPGSGGTQRLPRLIGLARAKEMILLGDLLDSTTALAYGLVNRVVQKGRAEVEAKHLAEVLASRGPLAMREAKIALDSTLDGSLAEGQAEELKASERVFSSADILEGTAAFLEKRAPNFEGR